jgi:hypothetical protein
MAFLLAVCHARAGGIGLTMTHVLEMPQKMA